MNIPKIVQVIFTPMALGLCAMCAYADVVVVVSSKSPITALRIEQAANIFLGKANNLPGWGEVIPIDLAEGSPTREEFYARTTGKSPSLLKAYWSKIIFTGEGLPPKEAANSAMLKKMMAENPSLMGYLDRSAVDSSVRIVLQPALPGAR